VHQPKFAMYADLSHSPLESLTGRIKTEMVVSNETTDCVHHGRVELMQSCVARFPKVFADSLEVCCGLVTADEEDPTVDIPVKELPCDLAISCLIHPLVGGQNSCLLGQFVNNVRTNLSHLSIGCSLAHRQKTFSKTGCDER
jgi:hypothetical protein